MGALAGLILDVAILVLLCVTAFYAMRLSRSLSILRDGRAEMAKAAKELGKSVDEAQASIGALQRTVEDSAQSLQMKINESKALSDELQIINEAGSALATRLEKLAEKSGKGGSDKPASPSSVSSSSSSFAIQDREFDDETDIFPDDSDFMDDNDDPDMTFASKAEQDLYKALKRNRAGGGTA